MTGRVIVGRAYVEASPYQKKTVETMTNAEIKNKLCKDVRGGCLECPVFDKCRYGQEAQKRGLLL